MRIPTVQGIIDRRILANFRIDADCMKSVLPRPFRPQTYNGYGIGGICLIRLKKIRPRFFPFPWGLGSENAAHRIAVEWDVDGQTKSGVYIPRRDTDSILNSLAGGTIFPGLHHRSQFRVVENDDHFSVTMQSKDESAMVHVAGSISDELPASSTLGKLQAASDFFEMGSLGYSETGKPGQYDGLELQCKNWNVEPLAVESVASSFFEDQKKFPAGSVEFDCALLMRGIDHQWHGRSDLCCPETTAKKLG